MTGGWRLTLKAPPALRVDAFALRPQAPAALDADAVRRLGLESGRDRVQVGELFDVAPIEADGAGPVLELAGDCSRFDRLGAGLAAGILRVRGAVGHLAGVGMTGGRLEIEGDAGELAGCAMQGGWLDVHGNVGDFAASALPGDMDGMRGGTLVIGGNAGTRLADRMRRGTVVVRGDVGDFCGSRMVAGTLALAGRCGAHAAYGMRRGSIVFAGPGAGAIPPGPTFVPVASDASVFWHLLARDLARFGAPFDTLARRRLVRWAGDLAVAGKGELLVPG